MKLGLVGVMYAAAYLPKIFSFSGAQNEAFREILNSSSPISQVDTCKQLAQNKKGNSGFFSWLIGNDDDEMKACQGGASLAQGEQLINNAMGKTIKTVAAEYGMSLANVKVNPYKADKNDIKDSELPKTDSATTAYLRSLEVSEVFIQSSNSKIEVDINKIFDSSLLPVIDSIKPENTLNNPFVQTFKLNPFAYTHKLGQELIDYAENITITSVALAGLAGLAGGIGFGGESILAIWQYMDGILMTVAGLTLAQGVLMAYGAPILLSLAIAMMVARWLLRIIVGITISNYVVIALMMPRRRYVRF